ncbi:MAG TPA: hypothetical protein VFC00_02590 [Micromonosporaceae bacterium]|nr:hypothetical protein [Micromonosporaceae bacterium]
MGFVNDRTYKLVFADPEFAGLEVRARSISIRKMLEIAKFDRNDLDEGQVELLLATFAKALVSWNLEEPEGEPVPATLDGLYAQDIGFVMQIIFAWMEAVAAVPTPLREKLSGGKQFPEVSLPMETLSPSPPS